MRVGVNIACDVTILAGIGDGSVQTLRILDAFAKLAKCKNCKHCRLENILLLGEQFRCAQNGYFEVRPDQLCEHFSYKPKPKKKAGRK